MKYLQEYICKHCNVSYNIKKISEAKYQRITNSSEIKSSTYTTDENEKVVITYKCCVVCEDMYYYGD